MMKEKAKLNRIIAENNARIISIDKEIEDLKDISVENIDDITKAQLLARINALRAEIVERTEITVVATDEFIMQILFTNSNSSGIPSAPTLQELNLENTALLHVGEDFQNDGCA